MNVLVLNTEFPSSPWRRAFADALIRLRPELNPDAADELSDSAFLRLIDYLHHHRHRRTTSNNSFSYDGRWDTTAAIV